MQSNVQDIIIQIHCHDYVDHKLCRFKAVAQRPNLKLLIHESTMDIFRKYTNELEQIQTIYEDNKVLKCYRHDYGICMYVCCVPCV